MDTFLYTSDIDGIHNRIDRVLCGGPTDVLPISGNDNLDYSDFATSIGDNGSEHTNNKNTIVTEYEEIGEIIIDNDNDNDNNNNNNNEDDENNQIENFELPIQLNDIFKQRTRLLKEQVVDSNMLGSDITSTSTEIKRLKNKLKMMIEDMKNNGNETYMINTNGEVTKEVN